LILETSDIVTADVEAAGLITLQVDRLPAVRAEHVRCTNDPYLRGFSPNITGHQQISPSLPGLPRIGEKKLPFEDAQSMTD